MSEASGSYTFEGVVDFIKGMSLMDAAKMVKKLEEELGVSAAAPVAMVAGGAGVHLQLWARGLAGGAGEHLLSAERRVSQGAGVLSWPSSAARKRGKPHDPHPVTKPYPHQPVAQ